MIVGTRLVFCFFLLLTSSVVSQNLADTYGIKAPKNYEKDCGEYMTLYRRLPADVRFAVDVEGRTITFRFPSEQYFNSLFDKSTDGIAIDVVKREQYKCYAKNRFANSNIHRGYLMPPIYLKDIEEKKITNDQGYVWIEYGELPSQFDPLEVECNLVIIQKKYNCAYHQFANLDYSNWGVLDMGLYRDSLSTDEYSQIHGEVSKKLRFVVPFEKNKAEFNSADIQPLYDSLHLTDYNVKTINIRAYTSIEGTLSRNLELQEHRANSIVQSLQAYQSPEIESIIVANENWVEFLSDVSDGPFDYLTRLSKEEIKKRLEDKVLLDQLEPILQNHRKAYIELDLQKKFSSEENDPIILKKFFDQSIAKQDINEAIYLQNIIFEKVRDHQLPDSFIGQLEVPKEAIYGPLLNNQAIFGYDANDLFIYDHIMNFEKLLELLPDNKKILYNLTALKMKAWREGELLTNRTEVQQYIDRLEKMGLDQSLMERFRTNYYIIMTQYFYQEQDYRAKDRTLREVYYRYKDLNLDDADLISLAKYLAIYSKFEWAQAVLYDRMDDLDVDEDLLFYYINLTINDSRNTQQDEYRKFLLNAIDKNNERFCDLFLPVSQGGYTFQLLDDDYLKINYCENCYSSDNK